MGGNVKGASGAGGGFENHEAAGLKVGDGNVHSAALHQSTDLGKNQVPVDHTGTQTAQATLDKMFGTPGIEGTGVHQKNPESTAMAAPAKPETVAFGTQDVPVESTVGNSTKVAVQGADVGDVNHQLDRKTA